MNVNLSGDPATFDPISGTSSTTMIIIAPCYNGLLRFDPDDPETIVPDLATSWEVSDDGMRYTFPLIQTAKFHDGTPLTSADAKYTFEVMKNPPQGTISARQEVLEIVDSIEAPDDYTVVFNLKRPTASFLSIMADCWMLVLPKHILEVKGSMRDEIVGTGPFKLSSVNRGVSYNLIKNDDYHVPDRPYLDAINVYVIPSSATTWNYLQNGQLQLFTSIQGQDAGAFVSGGNVKVLESPSTSFVGVVYNTEKAPFNDVTLRKALSLAIDRTASLAVTYNGQGQLGGIIVPGQWALSDEKLANIPGYGPDGSADMEEAKRLLTEAGYPDGLSVRVLVRKHVIFEPVGIFLKDQWAKIGVEVTLDIRENAAYQEAISSGDFVVSASGGSYTFSDPSAVFGNDAICGGAVGAMCTDEMQSLFRQQMSEMDPQRRLALVHELEQQTLEKYGIYLMYWRDRFMGQSTKLHGLEIHPNIDQNMRMEDVWLES